MKQPLLLLLHLLSLFPALELIAAGPPHNNDSDPVIHSAYIKFAAVKNISKRQVCPPGKHQSGDNCCDLCEPGKVIDKDCTDSSNTTCKECKEGEEYTDGYNYLSKCRRCSSCDAEHGLEVDKPCIRSRNVKCRCRPGFFYNSSEPCHHCNPCTKCEHDIIVEECTPNKDTICGSKQNLLWIIAIVIPLTLAPILFIIWKYWRNNRRMRRTQIKDDQKNTELKPLFYPDIDLTPYISDIAEEMTFEQVMKFIRKQGLSNPTIERINLDNMHDVSEKKIKLLECWYQEKGIKDAYGTLISSLKGLKLHALAQKIERKMPSHIQNNVPMPEYQNSSSFEESSPI
uniref:tumor necrosis factor receptor superfamily member 6 n=1 Tax=Euleptes europaea TaxID=460621 RepID=UPI0025415A16|nr:tumor necrosis factor receptor superfamily member 6 [Euleptes europaea]